MLRVLLIEDEKTIRDMVRFALSREGIDMQEAEDVAAARALLCSGIPDLILLDWMLPDVSGISFLRELRRDPLSREIPVIMLTARAEEEDRVRGLEHGADDYIVKPFSPREMIARVKAVIRRSVGSMRDGTLRAGDLVLDPASHKVHYNDVDIAMGPTEFRLLQFLMAHPERVYSRSQLLDNVWSPGAGIEERTVDVHIRRLRKVLEPFSADSMVQTVRGVGYRFLRTEQDSFPSSVESN